MTIAINTNQMNIVELMTDEDIAGTSFERPEVYEAYREMFVPAGPEWVEEHLKRLRANGIQPHFQLASIPQLETVERLIRRGHYMGPLNLTWVAIGGGFDGPNPYNMMNFISRVPDGACLTLETLMRSVLPVNTMAIAMGLHTALGNEDTLWGRRARRSPPSSRSSRSSASPTSSAARSPPARRPATSTASARPTTASTRPWPAWATRPTASPASSASPSTPEPPGDERPTRLVGRGVTPSAPHVPAAANEARASAPPLLGAKHMSTPTTVAPPQLRPSTPTAAITRSRLFPFAVFVLTFGLLLSDYMSRQVLSAVFPFLKLEWALTDTQLGSLTSIVALTVGVLAIPLSLLGDRWGRSKAIISWAPCGASPPLGCAIAANYEQMMLARFFIGLGEAAYGSVGLAVVLMVFSPAKRASLTGAFMAGGSFGSVLGVFLGGILAVQLGWRWSFGVMAILGLVLVALYALLHQRRPPRAQPAPRQRPGHRRPTAPSPSAPSCAPWSPPPR